MHTCPLTCGQVNFLIANVVLSIFIDKNVDNIVALQDDSLSNIGSDNWIS